MRAEIIRKVNRTFDRQINNGNIVSKYHKLLFNMTLNFTSEDWAVIRTKEFWDVMDNTESALERARYLHKCVDEYIKGYRI